MYPKFVLSTEKARVEIEKKNIWALHELERENLQLTATLSVAVGSL